MASPIVTRYYRKKKSDGTFDDRVYFGSYANFVVVRRPDSKDNYEDLQTCIDNLNQKVKSTVTWTNFG